ncbi:MAG TPA: hypothetical protein VF613_05780 [Longimicrobium sp.]|jgi:hypothetical protein
MGVERHNGAGWAGPARATYTLFEKNVAYGGPPIWLRARNIWRRTGGHWHYTSAGYAPAADIIRVELQTLLKTYNGQPAVAPDASSPDAGESPMYWESTVVVTPGPTCAGYGIWYRLMNPETSWAFAGSFSPGEHPMSVFNYSPLLRAVQWCVTAWDGAAPGGNSLPTGQQGFSRFELG